MRKIKERIAVWFIAALGCGGGLLMLCAAGASDAGEDILTAAPRAFFGLALCVAAVVVMAIREEKTAEKG